MMDDARYSILEGHPSTALRLLRAGRRARNDRSRYFIAAW
jgi:hypothetical protein